MKNYLVVNFTKTFKVLNLIALRKKNAKNKRQLLKH